MTINKNPYDTRLNIKRSDVKSTTKQIVDLFKKSGMHIRAKETQVDESEFGPHRAIRFVLGAKAKKNPDEFFKTFAEKGYDLIKELRSLSPDLVYQLNFPWGSYLRKTHRNESGVFLRVGAS